MSSIFSPRYTVDKAGVIKLRTYKNSKKFDEFYVDQLIKTTYKKVGEGPEDFVPVTKIVESKRDIKEVINSQNNNLFNIDESIKRFGDTGDLLALPPGLNDGELVDYTKIPEDHADYMKFMNNMAVAYDNLPSDLKGKMTMAEFIKTMDDDKIQAYIKSKQPKQAYIKSKEPKQDKNEEVKKDE